MSVQTVPQHVRVASHQRPSVFLRAYITVGGWCARVWGGVRAVLTLMSPPPAEDESYESGAGWPAAAPTAELPRVEVPAVERPAPGHPVFPEGQRVHPPFAQEQAYCQHVLDRMQHLLIDLRRNPSMTATEAGGALRPLMQELSGLVLQEQNQPRRMERNQRAAEAQATLLEDAVLRGVGGEAAVQAAAAMAGRAVHVGAEESTGLLPRITADMPDPREPEPVPVEVEPDRPWTPEDTGPETSESLSAICGDEQAEAGTQVAA